MVRQRGEKQKEGQSTRPDVSSTLSRWAPAFVSGFKNPIHVCLFTVRSVIVAKAHFVHSRKEPMYRVQDFLSAKLPKFSAEVRRVFIHDIKEVEDVRQQEQQGDERDDEEGDEVRGEVEEIRSNAYYMNG